MDHDEFMVRVWGVRGSYPVPGPTTLEFGGNTSCVEVRVGGHLIILDAGTGIIGLGRELARRGEPVVATLLFSHTHHDHTQGFPFFDPAYNATTVLYMFGPRDFDRDLEEALARAMLAPAFPIALGDMRSLQLISNFSDESEIIILEESQHSKVSNIHHDNRNFSPDAVQISLLRSYAHPNSGVNIYCIIWKEQKLVYATDTESYVGGDARLIAFAQDADLLIHDAQYTEDEYVSASGSKQGWGHSTARMALTTAKQAGVKRLAMFHYDPQHEDGMLSQLEREVQRKFPNAVFAREGMVITL